MVVCGHGHTAVGDRGASEHTARNTGLYYCLTSSLLPAFTAKDMAVFRLLQINQL